MDPVISFKLRNFWHRLRGGKQELLALAGLGLQSELRMLHVKPDAECYHVKDPLMLGPAGAEFRYLLRKRNFEQIGQVFYSPLCTRLNYGLVSRRIVTNNGRAAVVDAFQNLFELETFNYHGVGTNSTAEAAGDTALGTEVETRVAGTQSEPSSTTYRTVATVTFTATRTIKEHGIFNQLALGGTLWDRTVHADTGVNNLESIQYTYDLAVTGT